MAINSLQCKQRQCFLLPGSCFLPLSTPANLLQVHYSHHVETQVLGSFGAGGLPQLGGLCRVAECKWSDFLGLLPDRGDLIFFLQTATCWSMEKRGKGLGWLLPGNPWP